MKTYQNFHGEGADEGMNTEGGAVGVCMCLPRSYYHVLYLFTPTLAFTPQLQEMVTGRGMLVQ